MKKLILMSLFLFSYSAFAQKSNDGCIKEANSNPDLKTLEDKQAAIDACLSGRSVRISSSAWTPDLFANTKTSSIDATLPQSGTDTNSNGPKPCVLKIQECAASSPIVQDYAEFMTDFNRFSQNTNKKNDNCTCFEGHFKEKLGAKYQATVDNEKKIIKDKIIEALGRKFVNDFAANLEDASFFMTNNKEIVPESEDGRSIQCMDPAQFETLINVTCKDRGITDNEFIGKRRNLLLSSIDKSNLPFARKLEKLSKDVLTIPYPVKSGPFAGKVYTRFEYDKARLGLAHDDPRTKIVDHILKRFFKYPEHDEEISPYMKDSSPAKALITYLIEQSDNKNFMSKFDLDPAIVGDTFKNGESLSKVFRFVINTHPGFLSVMDDEAAFNRLGSALWDNPNKSMLELIETNKSIAMPLLEGKCYDMAKDFAGAVCTKDEDLIGSMNPQDLERLLRPPRENDDQYGMAQAPKDYELSDLLYCQAKESSSQFSNLANLYSSKLPAKRADYLERLLNPDVSKQQNMFSKTMLASMDEKAAVQINHATSIGMQIAKPVTTGGVLSAKIYAEAVVEDKVSPKSKPLLSKAEAKKFLKEEKAYETKLAEKKVRKESTKVSNNKTEAVQENSSQTVAPTIPSTNTKVAESKTSVNKVPSVNSSREQLNQYLSQKYRSEDVKRETSKVGDTILDELNKLRSQNLDLLQKNFDMEQKRLEGMQTRIENLQKRVATPVAKPESQSEVVPTKMGTQVDRSLPQTIAGVKNTKDSKDVIAPQTSTSNVSISRPDVSNGRGNPTQEKVQDNALDAGKEALTVSTFQGSSSIPIGKISEEVKKLVEGPVLDSLSLNEIKENGIKLIVDQKEIIVKFEDLDQKTKDLIELKFAKKDRDQQVSKLAVLKMLMGRYQR